MKYRVFLLLLSIICMNAMQQEVPHSNEDGWTSYSCESKSIYAERYEKGAWWEKTTQVTKQLPNGMISVKVFWKTPTATWENTLSHPSTVAQLIEKINNYELAMLSQK